MTDTETPDKVEITIPAKIKDDVVKKSKAVIAACKKENKPCWPIHLTIQETGQVIIIDGNEGADDTVAP